MLKKKGFTLIELVMIIVILGILAAVAIPRYLDLQDEAKDAAERGVVGGVRAGISLYYAERCYSATCAWPADLEVAVHPNGACDSTNPCFDDVLVQGGITEDWTRAAGTQEGDYTGPAGGIYQYNAADGSFLKTN